MVAKKIFFSKLISFDIFTLMSNDSFHNIISNGIIQNLTNFKKNSLKQELMTIIITNKKETFAHTNYQNAKYKRGCDIIQSHSL
jgi:hypothetical protein